MERQAKISVGVLGVTGMFGQCFRWKYVQEFLMIFDLELSHILLS
jgi:hypothetical protein